MTLQDQFDVFLCHNSKDKAEIKQIGQQLKQQGLQPWLDEWEFRPGSLFATTREILKQAGPDIGASHRSVGRIAITVLKRGLRPFLAKWHPLLQSWETQRPFDISPFEHDGNFAPVFLCNRN